MELYNVTDFMKKFPVGIVLSIDEFDQWCIDSNLINDPYTDDRQSAAWQLLLKQRNNTRAALNKIAVSDVIEPEARFTVEVNNFNIDYIVRSVNEQYQSQAKDLPVKVMQTFRTKYRNLAKLQKSTDFDQLSPTTQVQIKLLGRQAERLERNISFTLHEAQNEMEELFHEIREQAKSIDSKNGGLKAIEESK